MPVSLPQGAVKYAESPVFDERTVPAKLTDKHDTKADVWGKLCVLSGAIRYVIDSDDAQSMVVAADEQAVITPQQPHHVEIVGPVRFKVEFFREHEGELHVVARYFAHGNTRGVRRQKN